MKNSRDLPAWFMPVLNGLVIEVFLLICLGGSVRIMNAGLACPDWPLCFGDVIPDYHPQVYFEFIHRVMAGLVSITTGVLIVVLFRSKVSLAVKRTGIAAVLLLLTQVVFGGLTVLWQLQSKVVAAHLTMGIGFFLLLLWIYLTLKRGVASSAPKCIKRWSIFLMAAVYAQIILGGLVASHFASLVCIDFPKCQGEWIPTLSGIIGLHVIHRFGAYAVFLLILFNFFAMRKSLSPRLRKLSGLMLIFVFVQICIGIANVLLLTPPLIAVSHLAVGTATLSIALRQVHASYFG